MSNEHLERWLEPMRDPNYMSDKQPPIEAHEVYPRYRLVVHPECADAAVKAKMLEHSTASGDAPDYWYLGHAFPCRYLTDGVVQLAVPEPAVLDPVLLTHAAIKQRWCQCGADPCTCSGEIVTGGSVYERPVDGWWSGLAFGEPD